ncbi:MAG: glycosyltransferase family 4 protein [Planctomycetaceae bacterium]|nr:glycosyltransferase family 4 protein [Planctomycetaceae bacterium]
MDPKKYLAVAVVSCHSNAEYLRNTGAFERVVVDRARMVKRNGKHASRFIRSLSPSGSVGHTITSTCLTLAKRFGPVARLVGCVPTVGFAGRIASTFSDLKIDGVYLNNGVSFSRNTGALLARRWNVPLFCKVQGFESGRLVRILARPIDKFFVASNAVAEHLVHIGCPPEHMTTVFEPVDTSLFDPDRVPATGEFQIDRNGEHAPVFGIVGMLVDWKGQHVFLEAAATVLSESPHSVAVVVGDDPDMSGTRLKSLREQAAELGIADKVVFAGFRDDVPRVLANLDIVVHASVRPEPFGTIIAEGMAMRKAVVAARDGGPAEYVEHGKNGLLHEPGSAEQLAAAITTLVRDAGLRQRLGENGRTTVLENFSAESHAMKVQTTFDAVIEAHRSRI